MAFFILIMIAAVIDIGTNTFHLIIVQKIQQKIDILYRTNVPVKLGEGGINNSTIMPTAFERGLATLKVFKEKMDFYNVQCVSAIATSAVRSSANGQEFVQAALAQAGISIEIINGDKEAEYIYKGVFSTGLIDQVSLIMDIGGGSVEFILCDHEKLIWKKSYDIGAARLQQKYFKSDPISIKDQSAIIKRLDAELLDLKAICNRFKPTKLIGSAGAFETYAEMLQEGLVIKEIMAAPIDIASYKDLSRKLIDSTHNERLDMKGLIPLRVDMIVIAAMLTNYVLDIVDFETMYVSAYDLKMGVINEIMIN